MTSTLLLAILLSGALALHRLALLILRRRLPSPLLDRSDSPLIGNTLECASDCRPTHGEPMPKWANTYSDVFYLDIPGNPTLVINSAQAAADLFDKRSGNYADRPGK